MKSELLWVDRLGVKDGFASIVFDLCFKPDGSQVLVAVGSRIQVYDADTGDLVHSLKGHRDYVYCCAYSRDGKRFASGGADKMVIIWNAKCEGILKYSHAESIQCLAYNPVSQQLASCTAVDFGLWSPEQKAVQKFKVPSKVLCCAWTNDGQYIAIGHFNGHVTISDKAGQTKVRIERSQPVWTLSFCPPNAEHSEVLAVGCWDQTLSFYDSQGIQINKDRKLEFDPTCISYYGEGEYLLVSGSNKKVSMYTKDGVFLKTVAEKEDWVWTVRSRPKSKCLALGTNDGNVSMHNTVFSTVHGLYQDRYAHRDTMTDVIIQHLITEQKVRIKTRDYVKKIAVYKARLAVQLPDRVLIYETLNEDSNDMHYRLKEKIVKTLECNLLVVTTNNIILCQEKKLQLYNFKGKKVREWVLDAIIRYIRVVGGPPGREGLLVGLKNGCVYKIFIDNRFPVKLVQHVSPIRCLDLNSSRRKLAVVDENSKVFIYDLQTGDVLFEESNANSVAWNSEMDDMFCFSGNGQLCIKTGEFPIHKQALQGFVVGFKGSKIFCLHFLSMQTIDVPQSASMMRYLEIGDFSRAYEVACLGVTDSDWRELAIQSLSGLNFDISRKSFIRIRDVRYIELLNRIEIARKQPRHDDTVFLADIAAFQGNYSDASRLYIKAGQRKKAIEMYLDLRDWEKAKELVESLNASADESKDSDGLTMNDLLKRQAAWLQEVGDYKAAAEMYWAAKEVSLCISLLGTHKWWDALVDKVRQMNKMQSAHLQIAADFFRKANQYDYAIETFIKLDDIKSLLTLFVEQHRWDEAFKIVKNRPEFAKDLYLPYAEWLALNDRFDEAQVAFKKAGRPEESTKMLLHLTGNAIIENRYNDGGYYYWLLAMETLKNINEAKGKLGVDSKEFKILQKTLNNKFKEFQRNAEIYFAYHNIYRYTDEPFTSLLPEALFHLSLFLSNALSQKGFPIPPKGVSRVNTLFALAKQSKKLEAFKLSRATYSKLLSMRIPNSWRDQIEVASLTIRSKPFQDKDELLPVCYRCSSTNPLVSPGGEGDCCVNCGHPFIRSFCSFEILPLVEFQIPHDLPHAEAKKILRTDYSKGVVKAKEEKSGGKDKDNQDDGDNLIPDDSDAMAASSDGDVFSDHLMTLEPNADGQFDPIVLDVETLKALKSEEVFIKEWNEDGIAPTYYKSVIPDLPIKLCVNCNHFFHEEDYEFHVLQKNTCPFCRVIVHKKDEDDEDLSQLRGSK